MSEIATKRTTILLGLLICFLGALFYCYEYLLRIEPSVMMPELMQAFGVTAAGLGLLTALYYYAYTPMQLVVGIIIDSYGTRLIITIAICICAIGSFLFSATHSLYLAGIGRFMIGLGSAFAFVAVLKLAAIWLPKRYFALFAGLATALGMLGAMVGDIELTMMVHKIGWRHTLYIGTVIGVMLAPITWFLVRDGHKALQHHKHHLSGSVRQTFAGLLQIIKNPQMWLSGVIGCLLFLSLSVVGETWGIQFIERVYNVSDKTAAFACSLIFLGWLIGAPFNGWLSDHTRTRKLPLIICSFVAAVLMTIIIARPMFVSLTMLYWLLFLFGAFCSAEVICFAVSRENNPLHIAASSVAFTNLIVMVGGMVFQPLIGKLLDYHWVGFVNNGVRIYSPHAYQKAFFILPFCLILSSILSLMLRETYGQHEPDEFD